MMLEKINPNHLTSVRLFLLPFILCSLFWPSFWSLAICLALMSISELTDFFDGWIARRYNKVSDFGKIYDPMCDSIYHQLIFLFLVPLGLPVWVLAIFIARDLIVVYSRTYCASKGYVLAARWSGKIKAWSQAVFQFAFVLFLLFGLAGSFLAPTLLIILISAGIAAVAVALYSLFDYLSFVRRLARM